MKICTDLITQSDKSHLSKDISKDFCTEMEMLRRSMLMSKLRIVMPLLPCRRAQFAQKLSASNSNEEIWIHDKFLLLVLVRHHA